MRGDGTVYRRKDTGTWWVAYWHRGRQYREPGGRTEAQARKKLRLRMREIHAERFVGPQEERVSVPEVLDDLVRHLETRGARSVRHYRCHLKPVHEYFEFTRAVDLTSSHVERFMQARLAAGKARATVNRETAALRQALRLAHRQGRLVRVPHVELLGGETVRQGFFERPDFEALVSQLAKPLCDIARFAYLSGWRRGEILPLRWEAVDRAAREVRLRTSKNGHGRVLPLAGDLWALVERRWQARQYEMADGVIRVSDYVFHRLGVPVGEFRKSWATACMAANVPGRLFHDLRRTAVRNMIRAGVPQSVAMAISGHRTVSMFARYNITSADDMREAIRRTQAHVASLPTNRNVVSFPSESESR